MASLKDCTVRGVCLARRKSDGKIRTDMPDGTVRYLTDEEWQVVLAERLRQAAGATASNLEQKNG